MPRVEAVYRSLAPVLVRLMFIPLKHQAPASSKRSPHAIRFQTPQRGGNSSRELYCRRGQIPGSRSSTFETPCSLVSEPVRPLARVKCVRTLSIKQKHLKNIERTHVVVVVQLVTTEKPKERVEHTKMCFVSFLLFCNFGGERSPSPPGRRHDGHVLKC